jgi:uncharacterized membrane protein YebE (DUF533 family)
MFDAKQLLNSLLGGQSGGSLMDTLRSQGAQYSGQAGSALSGVLAQAQEQLKGTQTGDLLNKASTYASQNPAMTTAVGASLAGLLFGTSAGRTTVGEAAKVGGLALLGSLAYTAYQNFQTGKPLTAGIPVLDQLTSPPASTAFHADDHTQDSALVILRAMVAAAAADGHVDADERARMMQSFKASGMQADATAFFENEMAHPASVADLAKAVGTSSELAAQVYTGARLATATPSPAETSFLQALAKALPLAPGLATHIDAAAAQMGAAA